MSATNIDIGSAGRNIPGANKNQYLFGIAGYADDTFSVLGFESDGYALSSDYRFELQVNSEQSLTTTDMLGRTARLELLWDYEPVFINGIVTGCRTESGSLDGFDYAITLSSPLHLLESRSSNRVFVGQNARQIITDVLSAAGWSLEAYAFELEEQPVEWDFVAQVNESDRHFIHRIMARAGLFYRFEQNSDNARMVIHDSVEKLPGLPGGELRYEVQKGENRTEETLYRLSPASHLDTAGFLLRDYNDDAPGLDLTAVSNGTVTGAAESYIYGSNYRLPEEGSALARYHQEAVDCRRTVYLGETDCRGLMPGMVVKIDGHTDAALNVSYMVLSLRVRADQRSALAAGAEKNAPTYAAEIEMIPAGTPYRDMPPAPRLAPGPITARIETTGGDYAYLDEQGRYRIRMDFDGSDTGKAEASHPVRMAQPYAGNNYGFHFPLHADTEVLIGFTNNDVDRPYIIGAMHNTLAPNPVTAENRTQNILRTWGGNELVMDDKQGAEKIEMFTRDRKLSLTLDATDGEHTARLATEEGDLSLYAGNNMNIETGGEQHYNVGADHEVLVKNSQRLLTQEGGIEQHAGTDLLMKAGQNLRLQAQSGKIEQHAEEQLNIEAGQGMSVEVKQQDCTVLVDGGDLRMKAASAISVVGNGGGPIHFGQSGGGLEITTSGDVVVKGTAKITLSATNISIKGEGVGNNS